MGENVQFPTGDITMLSEEIHKATGRLWELIQEVKRYPETAFVNKGETIANAMLSFRSLEDAQYRLLQGKRHIATRELEDLSE